MSAYTEGWPKAWMGLPGNFEVVPLSDAERMREALEEIARRPTVERNPDGVDQAAESMQLLARAALNPERGE